MRANLLSSGSKRLGRPPSPPSDRSLGRRGYGQGWHRRNGEDHKDARQDSIQNGQTQSRCMASRKIKRCGKSPEQGNTICVCAHHCPTVEAIILGRQVLGVKTTLTGRRPGGLRFVKTRSTGKPVPQQLKDSLEVGNSASLEMTSMRHCTSGGKSASACCAPRVSAAWLVVALWVTLPLAAAVSHCAASSPPQPSPAA